MYWVAIGTTWYLSDIHYNVSGKSAPTWILNPKGTDKPRFVQVDFQRMGKRRTFKIHKYYKS
uniref:Uncharacterized protein n=1 Tax=Rhizophagus irregularis (strain DAOM 181602 / DAOM 197198 / MUCL 43194) TaxID=747089 RepID=U9SX05_RHIID